MQKTSTKRGRKKAPWPQLMEEIIMEILLRLPVESLLRFKSVCKAWRAMINSPMFIRDHLRHSVSKWERSQSLIISIQHTLDDRPFSNSYHLFRFYQWQLQPNNKVATFLDSKAFPDKFPLMSYLIHCDGLVFAATEWSLYLFNLATREVITLPNSPRDTLRATGASSYCAGLGLDPSTGKYKVVQAFYRSLDPDTRRETDMGMEVFTVAGGGDVDGGGAWREITSNPPYPAKAEGLFQTAMAVGGFMFWRLDDRKVERELRGVLHLSLEEEEFGITGLPDQWNSEGDFTRNVLRGRDLCLASFNSGERILNIWTLPVADEGLNTLWRWQYSIQIQYYGRLWHIMALPPVSNGIILHLADSVYCYDLATSKLSILCELHRMRYQRGRKQWRKPFLLDVKPFTESLIRIT